MSGFNTKLEFKLSREANRALNCGVYASFSGIIEHPIIWSINSTMQAAYSESAAIAYVVKLYEKYHKAIPKNANAVFLKY